MAEDAGELKVKITADLQNLKQGIGESQNAIEGFSAGTIAKGIAIGAALAAAAKVVIDFGVSSVKAFGEQEQAMARLSGAVGKDAAEALERYAQELQKVTIYSDDSIIAMESQLANFGLLPGSIQEASGAIADFASRTGKDLPEATNVFTQALGGNSRELKRMGLAILETDDRATRMNKTIGFMTGQFHGAGEEIKNTTLGSVENLKNRVDDLEKHIGEILSPAVKVLVGWLEKVVDYMGKVTGATYEAATATDKEVMTLKDKREALIGMLKTQTEVKDGEVKTTQVSEERRAEINKSIIAITDQIVVLKKKSAQEKKTTSDSQKGMKQETTAAQDAVESKISGLKSELEIAQEVTNRQMEYSTLLTQKKIADSQQELTQISFNQAQISTITSLETQKRLLESQASWEANASFSDQLTVKLAEDQSKVTADWVSMASSMVDAFAESTAKMIVEGGRFSDVLKEMWKQIAEAVIQQILRMIAKMAVLNAMGFAAGGGGFALTSTLGMVGHMAGGGIVDEPSMMTGLRTGQRTLVGEAGSEMVVPMSGQSRSAGNDNGITVQINGTFVESNPAKWQRLIREQIVPQIRRYTMVNPSGPFARRRGAA